MNNYRLHRFQKQIIPNEVSRRSSSSGSRRNAKKITTFGTQIIILSTLYSLLFTLIGCDAFVRKFTRKPKKENLPKQELVLVPQEYKPPQMTKEEVYRQYFLYWKSWHDELINSLSGGTSHKKQIDCANEAIKNLEQLRATLQEAKQKKLDVYINQLKDLDKEIVEDLYGNDLSVNRLTAERIRRNILRDFSYNKISKDISYGPLY